ncbi:CDP-alcohol phosphatidyltransferase family protein [Aquabacterium sp. A7-Y]|uniref:CDP-alcohol phosphatidyltransferase family protein n=1 Tax=Aquabacterium sp. A7-Y TaxID=1349605 RepID=UPI00223DECBC|nr:CDP-alcohol phosphatidyltransferase family protein [Aquabacterium sp. A7-Y]MCW7540199.1 CDP-alcohol phosphatidyltransferase family protein [Aquabacterium sp. A7-Y]
MEDLKAMFGDTLPGVLPEPFASLPPGALHHDGPGTLARDTLRHLLLAAALLAPLAWSLGRLAGLSPWYAAKCLALGGLAALLLWRGLPAHRPHGRFGAANRVTLLRLSGVALLAGGLGEPLAGRPDLAWAVVGVATAAALLDALDGPLARARGLASAFGARFDMETDALLMAVLSLLILQSGRTGTWVLAAGGLRYAFVAAAVVWPWLGRPLPPSFRRKAVCVVQIVCLIACLGPVIPPAWASAMAAAGLAALVYSFAADVAWLARRRHLALEIEA